MDKREIRENLLDILTSKETMSLQVDVKDIHDETSLINDVGLDSIQVLELIVAIENRFQFSIDTEEINIDIFDRFTDLIGYIENYMNDGKGG